jgi:nicotinate-nucleotide--dimethylbenzimidazole phosphoribosyltransferase
MKRTSTSDTSFIAETAQRIQPANAAVLRLAEARQRQLTKPEGSLGRLEEVANRCAAIFGSLRFSVSKPRIVVFAADHGVCAEGISAYPQIVTKQMVLNCLHGGAGINCLARAGEIDLKIVDVGIIGPLEDVTGLVCRNVAMGTRNFCIAPAMTSNEAFAALRVGVEMANEAVADGCNLLGFGEVGIGNTTSASAITAALTGCPVHEAVGRGTGADPACLKRKISAIERALALHRGHLSDPIEILTRVGGLEIAAMCGFCLGAAANCRPVLTDGLIATSAAALAVSIEPKVKDYLFASHASVEPGHKHLLDLIEQRPLLNLNMRLGEGTGTALAMKIIQGAVVAFREMATFDSAGVSELEEEGTKFSI